MSERRGQKREVRVGHRDREEGQRGGMDSNRQHANNPMTTKTVKPGTSRKETREAR